MIKAVFFDFFDTLAHYHPPRQQIYCQVLQEMGVKAEAKEIAFGLMSADKFYLEENAKTPVSQRNPQEQAEFYFRYQSRVLAKAGINADRELLGKLLQKLQPLLQNLTFVLYDDVVPTLTSLKARGITTALLTNATKNILAMQSKMGLDQHLDFIVTSQEVGADKPDPAIFNAALRRAGITAAEAIHVGDQYKVDVEGARNACIRPVLLDRYELYTDITDCTRITSLNAIPALV